MDLKLVAIGNRLLGDDGIAIKVIQCICERLRKLNITVVIGDTDYDKCFKNIDNNDYVFLVDSIFSGIKPGTVMVTPLNTHNISHYIMYSTHGLNLIEYFKTSNTNLKGTYIGIEIGTIDFSSELSEDLKASFDQICSEVYEFVFTSLNEMNNKKS